VSAAQLDEALRLVAGGHKPFAGGTDLMVLFESGKLAPGHYVSLQGLKELSGITVDDTHITLGALTTYTDVRNHAVLSSEYPNLANAARETGAIAIQNRGTIGGNIANASPAADSPPALLVAGAELELRSLAGTRWLAYDDFHTGYKQTRLQQHEIVTRIRVPRALAGTVHFYRKVGTRKAQAISKVCVAASARVSGRSLSDLRIALGSVGPIPLRAKHAEAALSARVVDAQAIADARAALTKDIAPIDDIRSTRDYRVQVAQNLVAALASHFIPQ
jgi:CO/xanthine dehydrogenase FAD-binding subunit